MTQRTFIRVVASVACAVAVFVGISGQALADWHVVQPGETLWLIGEQYGVDATDIASANNLENPNVIHVGEELWIPLDGQESPGTGGAPVIHIVAAGETLGVIAAMYGIDTVILATTNGIESPYIIFPGQELTIPYVELPVQPTPPTTPTTPPSTINPTVPFYDRETIKSAVIDLAIAYGWDPYLILSLAWAESTWDQRAISSAGAVGVMQLMPATAEWAGPALVGREADYVNSAWDNIETGIAYLSHLRGITGSDYLALASYFQGLASVERDGIFPVTRAYALGIIESRDLFANGALP